MTIKANADSRLFLMGFHDQHATAPNGILDRLREPLRADPAKLRDRLNEPLSKLPPLDQVPAKSPSFRRKQQLQRNPDIGENRI
jgi:hypothetical protein